MSTKKRKSGLVHEVIDLVALMPWWVGLALGIVSYLALSRIAATPPAPSGQAGQVGAAIQSALLIGAATAGQYILPLLCFVGAAASAWQRRQRSALMEHVSHAATASALDGMGWREFETMVGEAFRLKGYTVFETGGGGPDGGVDLVLVKGGERFLVQCKQWRAYKVGVDVVRELYGVMAARGAIGGFVVTSGRYSDDAKSFAAGRNIKLLDGPQLLLMIQMARKSQNAAPTLAPQRIEPTMLPEPTQSSDAPLCPKCGAEMTRRIARKGTHAGSSFWGCTRFPDCRGVLAAKDTT